MREIKFRGWESVLEEMIPIQTIDFERKIINKSGPWRFFEEIELMQYTGLKDKNGVEIYEGDIVPLTTTEETSYEWVEDVSKNYVIKFINGGFALHKDGVKPYGSWYWLHDRAHVIEVIGNIYENPELLDNKK